MPNAERSHGRSKAGRAQENVRGLRKGPACHPCYARHPTVSAARGPTQHPRSNPKGGPSLYSRLFQPFITSILTDGSGMDPGWTRVLHGCYKVYYASRRQAFTFSPTRPPMRPRIPISVPPIYMLRLCLVKIVTICYAPKTGYPCVQEKMPIYRYTLHCHREPWRSSLT
jgi:hypothetical protein